MRRGIANYHGGEGGVVTLAVAVVLDVVREADA